MYQGTTGNNKININPKIKDAVWLSPYLMEWDGSTKKEHIHEKGYYYKHRKELSAGRPVDLYVWDQEIGLSVQTEKVLDGKGKILVDLYYTEVDKDKPVYAKTSKRELERKKVYKYYKSFTGNIVKNDAYLTTIKISDNRTFFDNPFKLLENKMRWDIHLYIKLLIDGEVKDEKDFRDDISKILRIEHLDRYELYHYNKKNSNIGILPFYKYQFGFEPEGEQKYCLVRIGCKFRCKEGCSVHKDKPNGHTGIDIRVSPGTPVLAVAPGIVNEVVDLPKNGYGKYVTILHNNGLATLYGHNIEICVKINQIIFKGDVIAKAGSTGNSTGAHVHYEVRKWEGNVKSKFGPASIPLKKPSRPVELGSAINPFEADFTFSY